MSNVCRICLNQNISKDIFSLPYELNVKDTAYEVIKFCLDIDLREDSKHLSALCDQCHLLIIQFYKFKVLALETEQLLRSTKPCKNDDDENDSTKLVTDSYQLDDVIVKNEFEFKVESEDSSMPMHHDELKEPSTDNENDEGGGVFEDPEQAPKISRLGKHGNEGNVPAKTQSIQECPVCQKKFKYLKLHMLIHIKDGIKITCKACREPFTNLISLEEHYQSIHKDWERCKECNKYIKSLAKHMKRYHNKLKTLVCDLCPKTFARLQMLENHLSKHLSGEKRFFCNDCDQGFYGKFAIELHIRRDHMQERLFKCPHCDKAFKRSRHMKRHCAIHTAKFKTPKKKCLICCKTYINLDKHMKSHKAGDTRLKHHCGACNKNFHSSSYLKRHYNAVHLRKKQTCPICQKDVQRLTTHMMQHSSKKFACDQCPRTFTMPSLLKLHQIKHSDDRPHECKECGARFKRIESLQIHMVTAHSGEKNFLCQICSKTYARQSKLNDHLRTHNTERKYKCELCKKMLKSADTLRVHMLRHDRVQKYFCQICDKGFVVIGALHSHMLSHTKEKRWQCRVCDARFSRSDHRMRHERTAHHCHKDVDKDSVVTQ